MPAFLQGKTYSLRARFKVEDRDTDLKNRGVTTRTIEDSIRRWLEGTYNTLPSNPRIRWGSVKYCTVSIANGIWPLWDTIDVPLVIQMERDAEVGTVTKKEAVGPSQFEVSGGSLSWPLWEAVRFLGGKSILSIDVDGYAIEPMNEIKLPTETYYIIEPGYSVSDVPLRSSSSDNTLGSLARSLAPLESTDPRLDNHAPAAVAIPEVLDDVVDTAKGLVPLEFRIVLTVVSGVVAIMGTVATYNLLRGG